MERNRTAEILDLAAIRWRLEQLASTRLLAALNVQEQQEYRRLCHEEHRALSASLAG